MPSPHFTLCYAAILSLGSSFSSVNRHTAEADQRDRHQRDPQPHIAVIAGLGGRILPAAVLCPLGIERDVCFDQIGKVKSVFAFFLGIPSTECPTLSFEVGGLICRLAVLYSL